MKKLSIILLMLFSHLAFSQQQIVDMNINEIRGNDTTQGGCSDHVGLYVRTRGVIHGRNFRQSNNGLQISIIEKRADTLLSNKCGIGLFKGTMDLPVTINESDSIIVVGTVNCFNGLSQILVDSVRILKTNCSLISPRVVSDLNEVSESFLVKLLNMEFISTSWPQSPPVAGFTAKAFVGTPGTADYKEFDIRIDNDCDLYGQPMPQGKVDIIGIGGQFDTSPPINSRYQLLPRSTADINPTQPAELPTISFVDTLYQSSEGSTLSIPLECSILPTSQLSCLIVSQNMTTDTSDFSLQQPSIVTFPVGVVNGQFVITINTDDLSESDEQFSITLRKLSNNYKIGNDSVARVVITGTLSVNKMKYFDFYKNSLNGNLSIKLPDNFVGELSVYDSFGHKIFESSDSKINQDLNKLSSYPPSIYRVVIETQNKRFYKTVIN